MELQAPGRDRELVSCCDHGGGCCGLPFEARQQRPAQGGILRRVFGAKHLVMHLHERLYTALIDDFVQYHACWRRRVQREVRDLGYEQRFRRIWAQTSSSQPSR